MEAFGAPNDRFVDSIEIVGTNTAVRGSLFNATREAGEPGHGASVGETVNRTVWWHWTAPRSGWLDVSLSGGADSVAVYVGGRDMATMRLVATGYGSAAVPVVAGEVYRLVTGSRFNSSNGSPQGAAFKLSLRLVTKPSNDDFASRTILTGNRVEVSENTLAATRENNEPAHTLIGLQPGQITKTVWYEWIAPNSGRYSLWLDDYQHHGVIVYTGSSLSSVAKADRTAAVWDAVAGQRYDFAVIDKYEPGGSYALHLASTPAPANDNFANRSLISGANTIIAGDLSGATFESPEAGRSDYASGSLWWTWVAPTSGLVLLDTFASDGYPDVFAYTGSSLTTLTEVTVDAPRQWKAFVATAGTAYHIAVADGYSGGNQVVIRLNVLTPPANDNFANRTSLTGTNVTFSGNNQGATSEPGLGGSVDASSIWWKWTAPASGTATISLLSFSSSPYLAIYTGTSQSTLTLLISDSFGGGPVSFRVEAGVSYNLQISGRYGATGSVTFNLTHSPPAAHGGMALIPAGSFQMGDSFGEGESNELPVHTVFVSAFYMDKYEVTKALWDEVKGWSGGNGYGFDAAGLGKAASHPVHTVSWYDVVKWCNARSQKEGRVPAYYTDAALTQVYKTGRVAPYVKWNAGYRLPTEAEWEKAARGGTSGHRFPWSDADSITHNRANYYSDSGYAYDVSATREFHPTYAVGGHPYTSPVGSFAPNGYGLYDMAGNVWEWCWDWRGEYSSESQTDPRGPGSGSHRVFRGGGWGNVVVVIRGGGWYDVAFYCRLAYRNYFSPGFGGHDNGFRSALPPGQ